MVACVLVVELTVEGVVKGVVEGIVVITEFAADVTLVDCGEITVSVLVK